MVKVKAFVIYVQEEAEFNNTLL